MAKEKDVKNKKKNNKNNNKNKNKNNEKFLKSVKKEMKQVKWPSFKEILKYTIATIIFCVILVFFFEIIKLVMAYIRGLFN